MDNPDLYCVKCSIGLGFGPRATIDKKDYCNGCAVYLLRARVAELESQPAQTMPVKRTVREAVNDDVD